MLHAHASLSAPTTLPSDVERARLQSALVDRYRIERELGRGGFAVVYLAHDLRHDRAVALKVLHDEVAANLGSERFEREIHLAARLQHPHILGVFDSGAAEGRLWFTMPFIEGETLRNRMQRERQLPLADALGIAREVADALHYAHQHGVLHRDIKPENILLSGRHAVVADFGIARALTGGDASLTLTGTAIGSPGYMSPEQATGERDVDARSDVYALGCVLYEMLAGEGPFDAPTAQGRIARSLADTPRPIHTLRPAVSHALDAILATALAKVPADRFATAEAFGDALAGMVSTAGSTDAPGTVSPRAPRRPWMGVAAAAVLLLAGLGGALTWRSLRSGENGKALVVLPFESAGSADDAAFADGITEEVRGKLTAVPGLRVTARTSSNQYRGSRKTPREIGGELGVEFILTGTVRWASGPGGERRVRVTPELINASSGETKWQEPFDEVMSDVFKVQSGIATKVASALGATFGNDLNQQLNTNLTSNLEAYREYLKGEAATEAMARIDGKSLQEGLAHYERAAALDTNFAVAWSRVAFINVTSFSVNPTEDIARRAEAAIARAMRLAPDHPQVRRAHSRYLRIVTKDYAAAMAQLDTGLMHEPNNVDLLSTAAGVSALLSRWDAAVEYAKRAAALDPRNANAADAVQRILHGVRRFAQADEFAARALALSPGNISMAEGASINRVSMGDLAGAKAYAREVLKHADTTEVAAYYALFQEMQWVLDEPLLHRITQMTQANFRNNRQQWALKVGRTWLLLGDTVKGRAYGDSSRIVADAQLASYPNDAQLHELRGRALAMMGRNEEATAEAEQSLKMRETALDASTGPYVRYQVARILVQAGAFDRALDIIEPLLSTNYADVTPAWLTLEPVFRPLRGNARFDRIVKGVVTTQ